jgi:branched-chain amino acid transport system permease protein
MSGAHFRSRSSAAASLLLPLALVATTVLVGANGTPSFQSTVTLVLCNLIVVLGLQVFVGNSGVYSFGQLGFATVGAYVAALFTLPAAFTLLQTPGLPHFIADAQLGSFVSILIAAAISGLLAMVVGLPLMRTSTLAIPISTFAFLIVVYNVVANWEHVTGGSSGLVSIPTTTSVESAGLWAAAAVVLALAFKWSASGYRLQATREDEVAARSIGIGVMKERLIAFGISGVLCGVGGALAVHQSGVLNPTTFYFGATVTTMTMLVVGGARSVLGAVIGAIAISTVNELLRGLESGTSLFGAISIGEAPGLAAIGLGLILLATMIAMPNGLSGGREAGELSWIRRRVSMGAAPPPSSHGATARRQPIDHAVKGALRAEGVSLAFSGLQVLEEIDLTFETGEALGLIGPNGAGKTSLTRAPSHWMGSTSPGARRHDLLTAGWAARFRLPFPSPS